MKSLTLAIIAFSMIGCSSPHKDVTSSASILDSLTNVDTLLFVSNCNIDSIPFIRMQMNPEAAYITLADSVMPSEKDSTISLCVEAAFTGELLKNFKSSNIAGDYVIDGVVHKGYKCKANTGFLYADKSIFTIAVSDKCDEWIEIARKNKGYLFQQMLIVQNGENVYAGNPIKPNSQNIYRSACIMNDGNFAVIQSMVSLSLTDYIELLIKIGVSDALYLDMGRGWNYGWYRETTYSPVVKLFDYKTPYQTNWLVIRRKL